MKNIIVLIIFASFFVGCIQQMDYVFTIPNEEPNTQCKSSCVINQLGSHDIIIPAKDTAFISGLIGDTLRTYVYHLEDGRDGTLDKDEFDSLSVGDVLESCTRKEAVGSCPDYGGN